MLLLSSLLLARSSAQIFITELKSSALSGIPPTTRGIKLNTDGSTKANPGPGGLGGVFGNNNCEWILGYYHHIPHTTPTMAELLALRDGLLVAKEYNVNFFNIEMNS